jgi:hypothetical protein
MNTYSIYAAISGHANYTVEAEDEQDAIYQVESGNLDWDDYEIDNVEDCEVTDVEYGETEYVANVTVRFEISGELGETDDLDTLAADALYGVLQNCSGKTGMAGHNGTIELLDLDANDIHRG